MKTFLIKQSDYPEQWPFNCKHVKVKNQESTKELYIISRGVKYNFNGQATRGKPLEEIWLDNPDIPGTKKGIGVIFEIWKKRGL